MTPLLGTAPGERLGQGYYQETPTLLTYLPDFSESGQQSSREKKGSVRAGKREREGGGELGYGGRATGNWACAEPESRDQAAMTAPEAAVRAAAGRRLPRCRIPLRTPCAWTLS